VPQEDTSKHAQVTRLPGEREPTAPLWRRVPRGWIILTLFALAWLGVYLLWNGIRLVFHI